MLKAALASLAVVAVLFARPVPQAPAALPAGSGPDALEAEVEALRPNRLVWREIRWDRCLLEGMRLSRLQKKPIFLWAFINPDPTAERC